MDGSNGKPPLQSKTLWFNALAIVVLVAQSFGFGDFQLSPDMQQLAFGVVAIVNLALRFVTNKGIALR